MARHVRLNSTSTGTIYPMPDFGAPSNATLMMLAAPGSATQHFRRLLAKIENNRIQGKMTQQEQEDYFQIAAVDFQDRVRAARRMVIPHYFG